MNYWTSKNWISYLHLSWHMGAHVCGFVSACVSIQWGGSLQGDSVSKSVSFILYGRTVSPFPPRSSWFLLMQFSPKRDHLITLYICVCLWFPSMWDTQPVTSHCNVVLFPLAGTVNMKPNWSHVREISLNQWHLAGHIYMFMSYNVPEKNKMITSTWQKFSFLFFFFKNL